MYEKKELFVISDIHGHYTQLCEALSEAGYDSGRADHLLVCLGDCFDRGEENRAVMEYIKSLPRKVLVRGNHEDLLQNALEEGYITTVDVRNGTHITIGELLGPRAIDAYGMIDVTGHPRQVYDLCRFIGNTADYFESKNYIFTHGWIPVFDERDRFDSTADWRHATADAWRDARFTPWNKALRAGATVEKTVVCGHRGVQYAAAFDSTRGGDCSRPFYGDGLIAIDALTVHSGRVNVLHLSEEVRIPEEHRMSLIPAMFEKVLVGQKKIELRLFDEKRKNFAVGDLLCFCEEGSDRTHTVRIGGLYRHPTFADFFLTGAACDAGFARKEEALSLLREIYGEREGEDGILAIRLTEAG